MKFIVKLIERYNFVIFVVVVSIGLMMSVLTLNEILNRPYTNNTGANPTSTIFDQSTITRLDKLKSSANNNTFNTMPPGRTSPFSE